MLVVRFWARAAAAVAVFVLAAVGFAGAALAQTFTFTANTGSMTGAYPNFTLVSADGGGGAHTSTYLATAPVDGTVTFSWTYHNGDVSTAVHDPAGYIVAGVATQLTDNSWTSGSTYNGTTSFSVIQGQQFGWYVYSNDSCCGSGTFTVSASFAGSIDPANAAAGNFVSMRQQIIADAVNLPDIFNRGATGASVQTGPDGGVSGLAFAASTNAGWGPGSAADLLTRGPLSLKSDGASGSSPYSFWIDGRFGLHSGGGKFATAMAGGDMLLGDRVLLGLSVEGDWMTAPASDSSVSGLGVMAGPYVSVALNEHLALDANLMLGRSWNNVSLSGGGSIYDGVFVTNRAQAGVKLKGKVDYEAATLSPDISVFAIGENADGYTVTSPAGSIQSLPGFFKYTLEASAGTVFEYRLDQGNGVVFVPKAGVHLGLGANSDGVYRYASLMLGAGVITEAGMTLDVSATARVTDGGMTATGARATLGAQF